MATLLTATVAVGPPDAVRPRVWLGGTMVARAQFLAEDGSPADVTGVTFTWRRPNNPDLELPGVPDTADPVAKRWLCLLDPDRTGTWAVRAISASPLRTTDWMTFDVFAGPEDVPVPPNAIWVTPQGKALATGTGGLLTAAYIADLELAGAPQDGDRLALIRGADTPDVEPLTVSWGDLRAAAEAAGAAGADTVIGSKQDADPSLDALSGATVQAFGRERLGDADEAAARAGLGLGDSATRDVGATTGTVAAGDDPRFGERLTEDVAAGNDPVPAIFSTAGYSAARDAGAHPAWNRVSVAPSDHQAWIQRPNGEVMEAAGNTVLAGILGNLGYKSEADFPVGQNDQPGLKKILDYIATKYGGGTLIMPNRRFALRGNLDLPNFVSLRGQHYFSRERRTGTGTTGAGDMREAPGFSLDPAYSIRYGTGACLSDFAVWRLGKRQPDNIAEALTEQVSMTGTAIKKFTGADKRAVTIQNVATFGFTRGFDFSNTPGLRLLYAYGDNATTFYGANLGERALIEEVKQKADSTAVAGLTQVTVKIASLYDEGGAVGLVLGLDANGQQLTTSGVGITTGQRVGTDRLPAGMSNIRYTVTVIDATRVRLDGTMWDPSYASWDVPGIEFSFKPGTAAGVSSLLDDGGLLRMQLLAPISGLDVNHRAVIDLAGYFTLTDPDGLGGFLPARIGETGLIGITGSGWRRVALRRSDTDFTFDVPWDAAMSLIAAGDCEVAVHPGIRSGWGCFVRNVDGATISGTSKGGNGIACDSQNNQIEWSHEGAMEGELDLKDPTSVGAWFGETTARCVFKAGALKSTGTALLFDGGATGRLLFSGGSQFTDGGMASIIQRSGMLSLIEPSYRGAGRWYVGDASPLGPSPTGLTVGPKKTRVVGDGFSRANLIGTSGDTGKVEFLEPTPAATLAFYLPDGTVSAVMVVLEDLLLPAGLTGSFAKCTLLPDSDVTFALELHDGSVFTEIGTVAFAPGNHNGSLTLASDTALAASNRLRIKPPASPDFGIEEIAISLLATRA